MSRTLVRVVGFASRSPQEMPTTVVVLIPSRDRIARLLKFSSFPPEIREQLHYDMWLFANVEEIENKDDRLHLTEWEISAPLTEEQMKEMENV